MKTSTVITAFVLLAHAAVAGEGQPLALGAAPPLVTTKLKNPADGKALSIADVKGPKGTLVVFTANTCPFARAWDQRIVELGNRYAKQGIGVLLVDANDPGIAKGDTADAVKAHHQQSGMQFPFVVDEGSALARAFGATVTPEAFLFDKGGKLVYHGTVDDNHKQPDQVTRHYLRDALEAVTAGKAPPLAETKSMGCGIKFKKIS